MPSTNYLRPWHQLSVGQSLDSGIIVLNSGLSLH